MPVDIELGGKALESELTKAFRHGYMRAAMHVAMIMMGEAVPLEDEYSAILEKLQTGEKDPKYIQRAQVLAYTSKVMTRMGERINELVLEIGKLTDIDNAAVAKEQPSKDGMKS